MKKWEIIKGIRTDMSDYVLHCAGLQRFTRGKKDSYYYPYDTLKQILEDGFFRATFAEIETWPRLNKKPTVKGPNPAVCFTEQPLQFFIQSIRANGRYTEFGVAVQKDELFQYGGRPVIYSDSSTLDKLPDELKYLGVNYDPTAIWQRRDYPIDWTHEREWRVCPNQFWNLAIDLSNHPDSEKAVPIHLPHKDEGSTYNPHFVILVDTEERKVELIRWIGENFKRIHKKGYYWERYANALLLTVEPKLSGPRIVSFEEIQKSGQSLGRIEDFIK